MLELLWLLLPVAAASGWWAGYRRRARLAGGRNPFVPDYFQGLNYLLNEQQDQALEVFVRLVQDDSETVETHLALGNLFRRRGEVDKAIRIHQNLIARPTLTRTQRSMAMLELARDYLRAGVLDRAEGLFRELLQSKSQVDEALRALLGIYEQEHEWESAVTTAKRLEQITKRPCGPIVAHYYCELAEAAGEAGDRRQRDNLVRKALEADPRSVRASMLMAQAAAADGRHREAVAHYENIERQDPEFMPEVVEPLVSSLIAESNERQIEQFVQRVRDQQNSFTVIKTVADLIRERDGESEAESFFKQQALNRPSLRALREWVRMEWERTEGRRRESIQAIMEMLDRLLASKPSYLCRQCGFKGKRLHWQCPSCHGWNSVKPVIGIEGE